MKTERQKMTDGEDYNQFDKELIERRILCREKMQKINNTHDNESRNQQIRELLAASTDQFFVETGIQMDYGFNVKIGNNFYANYGLTLLDTCPITIGDNCYFGPDAGLYTPIHPLNYEDRINDVEYGAPITIGDNAWFGGHVTIVPGVTLGKNVVVGAGSVVTKSFGDNIVIAGNPAKIIKEL